MNILFLDTETFSPVPLKHGVHRYAEEAEIMIATWAMNDDAVTTEDLMSDDWTPKLPSARLMRAILNADEIVFHKSDFDRTLIRHCWGIDIPVEKIFDTMVCAMAHSLPGSLDKLCKIMGLPPELSKQDGSNFINRFCKPMPKNSKIRRATRLTHPAEWKNGLEYAAADIPSMRALYYRLPRWNFQGKERRLWELDQRINDRGFKADVDLARSAVETVKREQARLRKKVFELTDGEVDSATRRDVMLKYILEEHGVTLPDMKKDTLERRLNDPELPNAVHQLIQIRLAATTSSTAKYAAVLRSVSADGRLRGTTQFAGALRTGRWSGRLFQPQNLVRPSGEWTPEQTIEFIHQCKEGVLDLAEPKVMKILGECLRGMIEASPGKKIISADLKNIEGRIAAWLAGETWKLNAYRDYDRKLGPDLYIMAYAKSFNISPELVEADYKAGGYWRQVGKVLELAMQYEGGVGAFISFAIVYRLYLEEMAITAWDTIPENVRNQAQVILNWRKRRNYSTFGLSDRAFVVCESLKVLWRQGHPEMSDYWPELQRAIVEAVRHPGREVEARRLMFIKKGAWLRMVLPSSRSLCYPSPKAIKGLGGKDAIRYKGVNQYNRQWGWISTYGGKIFENACQAVARDVMAEQMPAIEEAGYSILGTVHDDVLTEAPDNQSFTSRHLCDLLIQRIGWLKGCPLSADGYEAERWGK